MSNPLGPIHPGEVLLEDFMKPLNLSAYRVAKDLGVAPLRITQIVHGKRAISAETALLLSRYTGTSPQFWINLQGQYDLEIIGSALSKKLAAINPAITASEALKQMPKGYRLAIPGRKKKIPRRVALEKSKRGRAPREGLSELTRKTEQQLCLYHCCYWLSLRAYPPTSNTSTVTVQLPRTNKFTVPEIRSIMNRISNKQLP